MSSDPKKTTKSILGDMNKNMDRLYDIALRDLKTATPKATGEAARSWKRTSKSDLGSKRSNVIIKNDAEHTQYLDDGHSSKASKGFIDKTIQESLKRNQ